MPATLYAACVAAGTDWGVRENANVDKGFVDAVWSDGNTYVATLVCEMAIGAVMLLDEALKNLLSRETIKSSSINSGGLLKPSEILSWTVRSCDVVELKLREIAPVGVKLKLGM